MAEQMKGQRAWLDALNWAPVDRDAFKALSTAEKLVRVRHSAAHVMASALTTLFPGIEFATGPATKQGFFYDVKTDKAIEAKDLPAIQAELDRLTGEAAPFEVTTVPKSEAIARFGEAGQHLKVQVLRNIAAEEVTLYRNGAFVDLCAGPHVPDAGYCRYTQLLTISAAHWRGEEIPSLTRVAGTAWTDKKDLKMYLAFLEEAKKRDHRVLGPQLELFNFHPWAAAAMWQPKGVALRREIMRLWRETIYARGYVEIDNPQLYRPELFQCSGHWEHFQENMFIFRDEQGEPTFGLKPMNCPDTMLYFRSKTRSYRDLPYRVAEGQILHRNEATGSLQGLMRTRNFIQDDAHIFLSADQVQGEILSLLEMLDENYTRFGLKYRLSLSTRPEKFMGEIAEWDRAEAEMKEALAAAGKDYFVEEGEGAFYGPKIDSFVTDSLGRTWQCGTVQLDFQLPERFDLHYSAQDGSLKRPIVIHRAMFGSFERFLGILVEHLGGAFPTWLSPIQAVVLPIADRHDAYGAELVQALRKEGIRAELRGGERVNARIRDAEREKIPWMLVVGDREAEEGTVAVRTYHEGQRGTWSQAKLLETLRERISTRAFDVVLKETARLPSIMDAPTSENEDY